MKLTCSREVYSFISVVYVTEILQRGILINRMNVCLDMSMGMCTKEIQNRRITKKRSGNQLFPANRFKAY